MGAAMSVLNHGSIKVEKQAAHFDSRKLQSISRRP
jgi:hypothetical protein